MKKETLMSTALIAIILILTSPAFNIRTVKANNNTNYTIEKVNHVIEVMGNGYIFINDTIEIAGETPNNFWIGLPYKYGSYIVRCIAYNATHIFPVNLNVPIEKHVGFYGVRINFPQGTPQVFTVGFVLSNNLITQDPKETDRYTLDFPAYPSLIKQAIICDASIILPVDAQLIGGTVDATEYSKENLSAFTYSPANATFLLTKEEIQIFDVKKLERTIRINGMGEIETADTYYITNKAFKEMSFIEVALPPNSSNPRAFDQLGRKMAQPKETDVTNHFKVTFTLPVETNKSTSFTIKYSLPRQTYIRQESSDNFILTSSLFSHLNYFINYSSVTYVLPEGAKFLGFEETTVKVFYTVKKSVFQETLSIQAQNVFWVDTLSVGIKYTYNILWLSFRPSLWIWALVALGCTIVYIWKRPKAAIQVTVPTVAMRLHAEHIESFVSAYEEKKKALLEIKSLEVKARKRKIPRRRYKVRRKMLETRLNTLVRNLTELKEKLRAAGGRYADLMRQLEVAETDIGEIETNIESIEARHRRGELSLGAYRKLRAEYERRKKKAETTIDGILIRLREEIR